jgi:hypothetical protein
MEPSRVDRILEEWNAVASRVQRPAAPPRRVAVRSSLSPTTLLGATALALALVFGVAWLGGHRPNGSVGTTPPVFTADPTATPAPTPTPLPTIAACTADSLSARITMWEGAAGHRIAHLEMTRRGPAPCVLETRMRPQLVDGSGSVLIDGTSPSTSGSLMFVAGERVTTLVDADNYCGSAPKPPVTVAFVLADGSRLVAAPLSPNDATVPPCNGPAGSAGHIDMHPWAR